jgi:hypothetical protein
MAAQRVTGVIWWRMGVSHYQSLYRRARGNEPKRGFTRDYLQASRVLPVMLEMFEGREPPYELTYRWGTGSDPNGRVFPAADYDENGRIEFGQFIGGVPPLPWRIGDPRTHPEITLPGDPDAPIPGAAIAQWEEGIAPLRPWLVLVQLDGDQEELHLRAYLENPPEELAEASFLRVPEALRDLMTARERVGAGAAASALPPLSFDPMDFRDPWRPAPAPGPAEGRSPAAEGPGVALPDPAPDGFGVDYRAGDEEAESSAPDPFDVDPDQRDRGTRAHHQTQNALAQILRDRGLTPRSPDGEPSFDIGWEEPDGRLVVVEVKSVIDSNAERQMRLGLGQVLRYRNVLASDEGDVAAVLALSAPPRDPRWIELCDELGIGLIWRPQLSEMLDAWLR